MIPYIITLIGIAILGPVLYFTPSNLTHKGKWTLLFASFMIAETGVLALNIFPYWQAAGILLLLIVLTSYLLLNRASSIFIDSAEMELAVAKEKSEEPKYHGVKEGSLSNVSMAEGGTVLNEGSSEAAQTEHTKVSSNEEETNIDPFGAGFIPLNSANPEQEYILTGENVKLRETDEIPEKSMDHDETYKQEESVRLDVADLIEQDNSEYIIESPVEADVVENIEEAEEEQFRGSLEVSVLKESETLLGGSEEQVGEEFYLASIEKMLEEEDMDDIDPLGTHTELYDSTVMKQTEIAAELEFFADGEADDSDSEFTLSQSSSSIIENDRDNKGSVHEKQEELLEEDPMDIDSEEGHSSSTVVEVSYFSEQQELNTLIIDSLKFAKYEMDSDSYISLLEKQLEKDLPTKMQYEITLMLINAQFKAGQYSKSKNLIEEMKLEFGHLPAVALELEILLVNVNRVMH